MFKKATNDSGVSGAKIKSWWSNRSILSKVIIVVVAILLAVFVIFPMLVSLGTMLRRQIARLRAARVSANAEAAAAAAGAGSNLTEKS